jgi:hypothetical protein
MIPESYAVAELDQMRQACPSCVGMKGLSWKKLVVRDRRVVIKYLATHLTPEAAGDLCTHEDDRGLTAMAIAPGPQRSARSR